MRILLEKFLYYDEKLSKYKLIIVQKKMWYWDYTPSGNYPKKPLSKKQLEKMQKAFEKADIITEHIRNLEAEDKIKNQEKTENELNSLFL